MRYLGLFLYFLIAVAFFGSIGVWLPMTIDYFPEEILSKEAYNAIPNNLLTYYLSVFFVAIGDRMYKVIDDGSYVYKKIELSVLVICSILCCALTYYVFMRIQQQNFPAALGLCKLGALMSFIAWAYANRNDEKMNPNNATPTPKL